MSAKFPTIVSPLCWSRRFLSLLLCLCALKPNVNGKTIGENIDTIVRKTKAERIEVNARDAAAMVAVVVVVDIDEVATGAGTGF